MRSNDGPLGVSDRRRVIAPVARRWKGQISEVAKSWAQFEALPESDHNTLAGAMHPHEHLPRTLVLFLRAPSDHPRNRLRLKLTKRALMLEGIGTRFRQRRRQNAAENCGLLCIMEITPLIIWRCRTISTPLRSQPSKL